MTIEVGLDGSRVPIDERIFVELFENSIVADRAPYLQARHDRRITFGDFVKLARTADIPYPLFFAPYESVQAHVNLKTEKLLQGITKQSFSLNTRTKVEIRDVELIVKDLVRKQELLKKSDATLVRNEVVGLLGRPGEDPSRDAVRLMKALDIQPQEFRSSRTKELALQAIIDKLEAKQILVSRSVNGFMPQSLKGVKLSGITIRDAKVPYVFLAGGSHGDFEEPAGRQVFTLTLLAVLVARGIFSAVTYDGRIVPEDPRHEYQVVGEILMPSDEMMELDFSTLESVEALSEVFKVTPSALLVRARNLKLIDREGADGMLEELAIRFAGRPKAFARTPKKVNGVRKYNGREFSLRMLNAMDLGRISPGDFCRQATLNRLRPSDIPDFRGALH